MKEIFINRTKELERLNKCYDSDNFEFAVIWGRRRIGEYFTRKAPVLRGGAPVAIRRRAPLNFILFERTFNNISLHSIWLNPVVIQNLN